MNISKGNTRPATILVIENEVSNRILVERVLATRSYRCISASNGREALEVLDHEQVDLILTDLSMPVMGGYRTIRWFRARNAMEKIPITAVTAFALGADG